MLRYNKIIWIGIFLGLVFPRNINSPDNNSDEGNFYRSQRPEKAFLIHQSGNLWTSLTNYGSVGDPDYDATGRPSAAWPAGSGNSYLYDAGLWIGTLMGGTPNVKTYFYNAVDKEWLPTPNFPGEIGSTVNGEKAKSLDDSYVVFDDIDSESISGTPALGIKVIRRGLTWGLPDYDDFVAFEYYIINTGLNGNLEDVYVSYWYDVDVSGSDDTERHIDDLVDYEGWDGTSSNSDELDIVDPFDLDADGLTGYDDWGIPYAKDQGQNPNFSPIQIEPDGFYDEWALIFDADGDTLHWQTSGGGGVPGDVAIVDGEVLKGWLVPRSISYIYDADNGTSSANDYGERENPIPNSGFLGGAILYTDAPYNDVDGVPYMGASAHQWWNWESDPGSDEDRWDFMQGTHSSSAGHKFLPNPNEMGFPQFDYRFLLTTGPLDIAEGDTAKIVFALTLGQGLQGLRENVDNAYKAYYSGSGHSDPMHPSAFDEDVHWNLPIPPPSPDLGYSPLDNGMRLAWEPSAEEFIDPQLGFADFEGYQIYRAVYEPNNWQMIAAFDNVEEPVFVVDAFGDTLNQKDADGNWLLIDLPDLIYTCDDGGDNPENSCYDPSGVTLWGANLEDQINEKDLLPYFPVNGLPYYYALVAYDSYKSAEEFGMEILPSFSSLSNYKKSIDGAPVPVTPGRLYETGDAIGALDNVYVVPNPYRGTALWERQYEDKLQFRNLPPLCKITIFSLSGDLIRRIEHTDGTDYAYWDLITINEQSVVSGIYLYVVEAPDISVVGDSSDKKTKFVGKFVVFR